MSLTAGSAMYPCPYHSGNLNRSLGDEISLMNASFGELGGQCLALLRFLAHWFFPALFVATQCLKFEFAQRALRVVGGVLGAVAPAVAAATALQLVITRVGGVRALLALEGAVARDDDDEADRTADSDSAVAGSEARVRAVSTSSSSSSLPSPRTDQQSAPPPPRPPRHIAVIMDGNRRYGKTRLGSSLLGHRAGGEKLREVVRWCRELGVEMLTVYAFSTENWSRPQDEIDLLMELFAGFFEQMLLDAAEIGIRIRFMSSDPERLPGDIRDLMRRVERATRQYADGICVNVCASYGSRSAVLRAVRSGPCARAARDCAGGDGGDAWLLRRLAMSFVEEEEEADEHRLDDNAPRSSKRNPPQSHQQRDAELWAAPDMLVRTSGEMRLSNFMLLEMAYAEMFFLGVTWPEVTRGMLLECIAEFTTGRERRLGK